MTTPTCLNCGAKFSHDNTSSQCRSCGIPDEIVDAGPEGIRLWEKKRLADLGFSRRHAKDTMKKIGANKSRPKNKHGRRGVKR